MSPNPCPLTDACQAPRCKSDTYRWVARSTSEANLRAFEADCVAYMQVMGERTPRRALKAVFTAAMGCPGQCVMA